MFFNCPEAQCGAELGSLRASLNHFSKKHGNEIVTQVFETRFCSTCCDKEGECQCKERKEKRINAKKIMDDHPTFVIQTVKNWPEGVSTIKYKRHLRVCLFIQFSISYLFILNLFFLEIYL